MNEKIIIGIICFIFGILACIIAVLLHNRRTTDRTGESIERAEIFNSEVGQRITDADDISSRLAESITRSTGTSEELAESIERSENIFEQIRKQKNDD